MECANSIAKSGQYKSIFFLGITLACKKSMLIQKGFVDENGGTEISIMFSNYGKVIPKYPIGSLDLRM